MSRNGRKGQKAGALGDDVFAVSPGYEDVARRAYEIYLERGAEPGRELEDWLRAEAELGDEGR